MTPWLTIVGVGEDGLPGLSPAARAALHSAEILVGGERHLAMVPPDGRERHAWPKPLAALVDSIVAMRGRRVCVLSTGDPMSFGVGATLAAHVPANEMLVLPHLSAFTLAAARLAWPRDEVTCLSLHARPVAGLAPHITSDARLILLTNGPETPGEVATVLRDRGYGASRIVALAHMGGPRESRIEGIAESWNADVPDLHTLAIECIAGPDAVWHPRTGLPDDAFAHDGQITKRDIRVSALARLMPQPGGLLWDIGAGCGSVAIEWMRAADRARAIAIETDAGRRAFAQQNASTLGTPALELIEGEAPEALQALPQPDAIFIGGGLSRETISASIAALPLGGRLVAHAVTLEREALILATAAEQGGDLTRLSIARAEPLGDFSAWRPAMPVTQWAWRKP